MPPGRRMEITWLTEGLAFDEEAEPGRGREGREAFRRLKGRRHKAPGESTFMRPLQIFGLAVAVTSLLALSLTQGWGGSWSNPAAAGRSSSSVLPPPTPPIVTVGKSWVWTRSSHYGAYSYTLSDTFTPTTTTTTISVLNPNGSVTTIVTATTVVKDEAKVTTYNSDGVPIIRFRFPFLPLPSPPRARRSRARLKFRQRLNQWRPGREYG